MFDGVLYSNTLCNNLNRWQNKNKPSFYATWNDLYKDFVNRGGDLIGPLDEHFIMDELSTNNSNSFEHIWSSTNWCQYRVNGKLVTRRIFGFYLLMDFIDNLDDNHKKDVIFFLDGFQWSGGLIIYKGNLVKDINHLKRLINININ